MKILYAVPVTGSLTWCPVLRQAGALDWLMSYHYTKGQPLEGFADIPKDHRPSRRGMVPKQRQGSSNGKSEKR